MRGGASLLAAAGACLLALAVAGGATTLTASDFSAATTNTGNTFTAASRPNEAPAVTAVAIGRSGSDSTGHLRSSATYYVYANASDDTAVSSVKANVANVTSGQTAVTLTAGSFSAGGVSYGYRSALLTAGSALTAGAKSFTATATDGSALTGSATGSVTVDATAPTAASIAVANRTGGTLGRAEQGDTVTYGFSEAVENGTVLDGWDGTSTPVQVGIFNNGKTADTVQVYDSATTLVPLGTVDLGRTDVISGGTGTYVSFGAAGAAVPSTMVRSGNTIVITLGTPNTSGGGAIATTSANGTPVWTPSATILDLAGNAMSASTRSGTAARVF